MAVWVMAVWVMAVWVMAVVVVWGVVVVVVVVVPPSPALESLFLLICLFSNALPHFGARIAKTAEVLRDTLLVATHAVCDFISHAEGVIADRVGRCRQRHGMQ